MFITVATILRQLNQVHILKPYSINIHFNIVILSGPGLASYLFLVFCLKFWSLRLVSPSAWYMFRPYHNFYREWCYKSAVYLDRWRISQYCQRKRRSAVAEEILDYRDFGLRPLDTGYCTRSSWLKLLLSNGPNRVGALFFTPDVENKSSFRNVVFFRTPDDGRNPETSVIQNANKLPWKQFRID